MNTIDNLTCISNQLDSCVQLWLMHSLDLEFGGYYNCLMKDGRIYDTTKYGWLQGRQVWMLAKLYNQVDRYRKPEILDAALHGYDFLEQYIKSSALDGRCYFSVTRDGHPLKVQRTMFSESFYMVAVCQLYKATNDRKYLVEALKMTDKIWNWIFHEPEALGISTLPNPPPTKVQSLNVPLILLGMFSELYEVDSSQIDKYIDKSRRCVQLILKHRVEINGRLFILENIDQEGNLMQGSFGNLLNPGHSIEAGWFLLQYLVHDPDFECSREQVIHDFIITPLQYGWDEEHGGIFYFLDARGYHCRSEYSPVQLEWHMKLWWPHAEALIALLMSYQQTKKATYMDKFKKVYNYVLDHFVDLEFGDWYGYLNQYGQPVSVMKGAPFKGFFHVPRCLMMCEEILGDIAKA